MNNDDLQTIIEMAVRAPSVHNTQPWRYSAHADDKGEIDAIDVFSDRDRSLGVIDPFGRELHISCGAAIEFAEVAIRSLGRQCTVGLLPNPDDSDHLARIEIGAEESPTDEEVALAKSVPLRYTERDRFDDRPVPPELVKALRQTATTVGTWIRVLDQPGDEVTTAVLLAHADDLERLNPDYERELASWTHKGPGANDGVPASALSSTPVDSRASSFRLRDFEQAKPGPVGAPPSGTEPPSPEHPLVIVLGTDSDDPHAWLTAGRALGRVLLRAAADGVSASPMTQVLEVPATRAMLAGQLDLVGHPQMLLRMGYGHGQPTSPRRAVGDVLST
ncbi:MAG: Acg family FMN-binding oxidoreductase [Acidimicrobiales bacterium]